MANFFGESTDKKIEKEREDKENQIKTEAFYSNVVAPAFEALKNELENYGRKVSTHVSGTMSIISMKHGEEEYDYEIRVRGDRPYCVYSFTSGSKRHKGESAIKDGGKDSKIPDISKEEIINNFLEIYRQQK